MLFYVFFLLLLVNLAIVWFIYIFKKSPLWIIEPLYFFCFNNFIDFHSLFHYFFTSTNFALIVKIFIWDHCIFHYHLILRNLSRSFFIALYTQLIIQEYIIQSPCVCVISVLSFGDCQFSILCDPVKCKRIFCTFWAMLYGILWKKFHGVKNNVYPTATGWNILCIA